MRSLAINQPMFRAPVESMEIIEPNADLGDLVNIPAELSLVNIPAEISLVNIPAEISLATYKTIGTVCCIHGLLF